MDERVRERKNKRERKKGRKVGRRKRKGGGEEGKKKGLGFLNSCIVDIWILLWGFVFVLRLFSSIFG